MKINNYFFNFLGVCTIFQACLQKSLYLPRFCYHVKLKLAGNCRLCFVEDFSILKPIIACATLIYNNAVILTNSAFVFKARENILEFLLTNHPLDCGVCDQGGECDLQDQYVVMGNTVSRFYETLKKNTDETNISFILKLSLNKCINCSRCTRYAHDICGEYNFSLLGRGQNLKISSYVKEYYFFSEISANMIDLCPVGAITLKNIAYSFRFWELLESKFVDFFDVFHPPIRIDFRGLKIIRVLPVTDDFMQEEWISDTTRFNFDYLNIIKQKFCSIKKSFISINVSWLNTFYLIKSYYFNLTNFFIKKKTVFLNMFFFSKNSVDIFQTEIYKNFFNKFSFFNLNYFKNSLKNGYRLQFLNNKCDLDFLKTSLFLIFNLNIRFNLPILNFKIREKIKYDFNTVFYFGPIFSANIFFLHCGNSIKNFIFFFKKSNYNFTKNEVTVLKGKNSSYHLNFFKLLNFFQFKNNVLNLNFFCYNSFELLNAEVNLLNKNFHFESNYFFSFFSLCYEISNFFKKSISFFNFKSLKITSDISPNIKNFNVRLPLINLFEKPAMFLNVFGSIGNFTYSFYKFFSSNFKADFNIINIFSEIFSYKINFKISTIQKKYIPKSWLKQNYFLKIFSFNFFEFKLYSNLLNFYIISAFFIIRSVFNSFYSKIHHIFFKKLSSLQMLVKINSIQWLF